MNNTLLEKPARAWRGGQPRSNSQEACLERPKYGVLIVDDDPCVRGLLGVWLQKDGFAVWLAASGQEALELYQQHADEIQVVLLDVRMPGLDGPQTLAALRQLNPSVRSCFMSGGFGRYSEEVLRGLGAVSILRKPFPPAEAAELLWQLADSA
jgi:CheY-like chemotaxis protein